jgi:hypothetical protein
MATTKSRGQIINHYDTVQLTALFRGTDGNLVDLPNFPQISITDANSNVVFDFTSAGVYRIGTGEYGFDFTLGAVSPEGIWVDTWRASLDGYNNLYGTFNFVVFDSQLPQVPSDGYESLGQDVGFDFSPTAIHNINKILKQVKARLKSAGFASTTDSFGNRTYVSCDVFSTDTLITFICDALAAFNQYPHFTSFTFDDTGIINNFFDLFVQKAVISALASQALIERGREFALADSGVSVTLPSLAEMLNTQYSTELTNWTENAKYIKAHMKPNPVGVGSFSVGASRVPVIDRLRNIRGGGRLF